MLTPDDFKAAREAALDRYPKLAARYRAGDPVVTESINAVYMAFSMLSSQIDVAMAEPHAKTRDATVLADAAIRGIVPKASAARVNIGVTNQADQAVTIDSGRTVFDSSGNPYLIEESAAVPAGGRIFVKAIQQRRERIVHTVSNSGPFYAIEIPPADDGSHLAGVELHQGSDAFEYRNRYVNANPGDLIFHIEADHQQRVYVRLGAEGIVGYQPNDGTELALVVVRSFGAVQPEQGSPFSFEYVLQAGDQSLAMEMDSMEIPGSDPLPLSTIRELTKYPSVYNDDAVFLGEFDFLVRKSFPDLQFLSVWNEALEEETRGASIQNINALFVACFSGDETVLKEPDPDSPVVPETLMVGQLSGVQTRIKEKIRAADDSYRVRFLTPVESLIPMTVMASVPTSYIPSVVKNQIEEALLKAYGKASKAARKGRNQPGYFDVYELLKSLPALSDAGSDVKVSIGDAGVLRPELWRYTAVESLDITVQTRNVASRAWG